MVDMCELSESYYFNPAAKGSNSLKYLLPAILRSSDYLKNTYKNPVYGAENGIPSKNFRDWQWIEFEDDGETPKNPYKSLPKIFDDLIEKELVNLTLLSDDESINQGGAAMMAYEKCQASEMIDLEREQIEKALLKYCELDTLAMVLIYEEWRELIK